MITSKFKTQYANQNLCRNVNADEFKILNYLLKLYLSMCIQCIYLTNTLVPGDNPNSSEADWTIEIVTAPLLSPHSTGPHFSSHGAQEVCRS